MGTIGAIALSGFTLTSISTAQTDIAAEGVSDYGWWRNNGHPEYTNIDCSSQVTRFYDIMVNSGQGWTHGPFYENSLVYDTDFRDPNVGGGSASDADTYNFDRSATAIAMACGHGLCDDAKTKACSTAANCSAGQACMGNPPSAHNYSSACAYNGLRTLLTSSSSSTRGNVVYYGDGHVKLGETASWGGAGTNGGDMVSFILNSCGVRPPFFFDQVKPLFAGLTQLDMIMPISNVVTAGTADAVVHINRGWYLATYATANPYASISGGWFNNLDTAPSNLGGGCPDKGANWPADYTYGGGHGITGCGAHISMGFDSSPSLATWDVETMTWALAANPSVRSNGSSAYYAFYHCNYDCNTYPVNK